MIDTDVQSQQLQILERVFERGDVVETPPLSGILTDVPMYYDKDLTDALGQELGVNLALFVECIDLENPHPDLFEIFDGQLVGSEEGSFSRYACDVLKLVSYGKSVSLSSEVLASVQRGLAKHEMFKTIAGGIGSPYSHLMNVRFIKDSGLRRLMRERKDSQEVGLAVLHKKGESFWIAHPADFSTFYRHQNIYQRDIDEARNRLIHLKKFNLPDMASEVERYIEEIQQKHLLEQCCGFNRISLTAASIILGKQIGVKFTVDVRPYSMTKAMAYIEESEGMAYVEESSQGNLFNRVEYKPKTYPIYQLNPSEAMNKVVDHLDNCPEIGGKPLFDHYRVLRPDFADGQRRKSDGVLLGEKDGDHYFICYWEPHE